MIIFSGVSFRYPGAEKPVLQDVALHISAGELALVVGPSGVGKSTLLRCINGLVPHFTGGVFAGRIEVHGLDPVRSGPEVMCHHVGFVFQDPEAQFVMDSVEDEVAFVLENAALPRSEIQRRVGEVLELLDLVGLRHRPLATLSGGEKQRVAIAAALALRPEILVLDEPTSQLDPESAEAVLEALTDLKVRLGLTIVLAEHRLERVLAFTDQVVLLEEEGSVTTGPPVEVLQHAELVPPVVALGKALGWYPPPLTVEAARSFVRGHGGFTPARWESAPASTSATGGAVPSLGEAADASGRDVVLRASSLHVGYDGTPVLCGVDLTLRREEVTVLMGPNGAGKTTLLRTLVGLLRPQKGRVWLGGRDTAELAVSEICRHVAYLPQDPNALLFAETVYDELLITLRNHEIPVAEAPVAPELLLAKLGLEGLADAYPRDLSVGERQRVALAAITITHPEVVILDEPTRGLDYIAKARLLELIRAWRQDGRAVLVVTHDVELAAAAADRVVLLDRGQVQEEGAPSEVLAHSTRFAPQIARLFANSGWLTVDDVVAALATEGRGSH